MSYMPEITELTVVPPWPFFVRPTLEALEGGQLQTRQEILSFVKANCRLSQEALRSHPFMQPLSSHGDQTPIESIENSISVLVEATKGELLSRLRASDPTFFEKAVIKRLLALGYGGAEQRSRQIGGTGDGGVIDQDALGLEKIYVQAKRYAETASVGSATIREFIGALAIKGVPSSDLSAIPSGRPKP